MKQIIEIAKYVKKLKIVTNKLNRFSYLEKKLYVDYGIALQITNNKRKALSFAELIINYDLKKEELLCYNILPYSIIVNVKNTFDVKNLSFNGTIFNYYEIEYNNDLVNRINHFENYDKNVLYESLVYRKDTFEHIKKQFYNDNVKLIKLCENSLTKL